MRNGKHWCSLEFPRKILAGKIPEEKFRRKRGLTVARSPLEKIGMGHFCQFFTQFLSWSTALLFSDSRLHNSRVSEINLNLKKSEFGVLLTGANEQILNVL